MLLGTSTIAWEYGMVVAHNEICKNIILCMSKRVGKQSHAPDALYGLRKLFSAYEHSCNSQRRLSFQYREVGLVMRFLTVAQRSLNVAVGWNTKATHWVPGFLTPCKLKLPASIANVPNSCLSTDIIRFSANQSEGNQKQKRGARVCPILLRCLTCIEIFSKSDAMCDMFFFSERVISPCWCPREETRFTTFCAILQR